jgi:hypothetical protein
MKPNMPKVVSSVLIALTPLGASGDNAAIGRLDRTVRVLDNTGESRGQMQVAARIASNFTALCGSEGNALALVNALHSGRAVRLQQEDGTYALLSARAPMGWGRVKLTLALVQSQLQMNNAHAHAKVEQVIAALGEVVAMRAAGMSWAQVAEARGAKVDVMVSSLKRTQATVSALPTTEEISRP